MRIELEAPSLARISDDLARAEAQRVTRAMRVATEDTKLELREQVVDAGLGGRLANTWRDEVYPQRGNSLNPAGVIWSNAPDIVDAFSRGATIVPLGGKRYLAIPTRNTPRAIGRRGSTRRMTPAQVEVAFDQDLFFLRGRAGRLLAFVNVVTARNQRGFRRATPRRLASGRDLQRILMFVFVPAVRAPKLLNPDAAISRWQGRFDAELAAAGED